MSILLFWTYWRLNFENSFVSYVSWLFSFTDVIPFKSSLILFFVVPVKSFFVGPTPPLNPKIPCKHVIQILYFQVNMIEMDPSSRISSLTCAFIFQFDSYVLLHRGCGNCEQRPSHEVQENFSYLFRDHSAVFINNCKPISTDSRIGPESRSCVGIVPGVYHSF